MSDLAKRAVACKHWRWMPGMLAIVGAERQRVLSEKLPAYPDWIPDLTDPATLGCLLALVREAWTDPGISCVIGLYRNGIYYWRVVDGRRQGSDFYAMSQIMRLTEAEALVVALEAAPC